ncbi:MAG: caspase family protein [Bacteroidetes bacterium]|nr:caspase family protein [Bacteroidota bacterium]
MARIIYADSTLCWKTYLKTKTILLLLFFLAVFHVTTAQTTAPANVDLKKEKANFSMGIFGGMNLPLSNFAVYNDVLLQDSIYGSVYYDHSDKYKATPVPDMAFGCFLNYRVSNYFAIQFSPSYYKDRGKISDGSTGKAVTHVFNTSLAGVLNITEQLSGSIGPSLIGNLRNVALAIPYVNNRYVIALNMGVSHQLKNGINIGAKYNFNLGKLYRGNFQYINSNGVYQDYESHNPGHLQILLGYNFTFKKKKDKEVEELKNMLNDIIAKQQKSDTTGTEAEYRGSGDPLKGLNVLKAKELQTGKYYALIIGIDKYTGAWTPLKNAVRDAKAIQEVLTTKYEFTHFKTLFDGEATGENIVKELEWLVDSIKENDNVFIYYSGHGEYKQSLIKGYWVPVDATTTSTYKFISNSDIQTFLAGIKSKHTLLVSDACFSGDIFRGITVSVPFEDSEKYYKKAYNLKSCQAITSGGLEPVMDGGREGHSVFAFYFLKMLKENNKKYYDTGQLYNDLKIPVTNNSNQSPNLQPIKDTGDEGGQFIFIKKEP